ncbi:MAG TPA: hypothetical protein VF744_21660 [Beijerinckiaceae bacterium]|jgi:hypothetical protein
MTDETGRWQPIDTAPDDKDVLIYVPAWGPLIARFSAEFGEWTSRMQCPVSLAEETDRPTHWMALPEPPAGGAADASEHDRFLASHPTPKVSGAAALKTGH